MGQNRHEIVPTGRTHALDVTLWTPSAAQAGVAPGEQKPGTLVAQQSLVLQQADDLVAKEQLAVMQELGAEHLGHHEDPPRVPDILQDLVSQQRRGRLCPLGSTRRAQVARLA
jgi:hypothetical protein